MIGIVDYQLGNVKAFANIYKELGIPHLIVSRPDELAGATRLIVPGVGAFDQAMVRLERSGMRARLQELVEAEATAVIGAGPDEEAITLAGFPSRQHSRWPTPLCTGRARWWMLGARSRAR